MPLASAVDQMWRDTGLGEDPADSSLGERMRVLFEQSVGEDLTAAREHFKKTTAASSPTSSSGGGDAGPLAAGMDPAALAQSVLSPLMVSKQKPASSV
jgi:hypothetical protein